MQKLDTTMIEAWHTALRARLSPRTAGEAHRLLARALADAVTRRLVARNVAREQGPPPGQRPEPRSTLTADQIPALLGRLGMPEITWHSLRHAHASLLIAHGVPVMVVAARFRHADTG